MHPEIVSDKTRQLPICKMKLEPVANESCRKSFLKPTGFIITGKCKTATGNNGNTLKAEAIVPAQNRNQSVARSFWWKN